MPIYLPVQYSSRSAFPAGLASLRSARASRRRRRMLGQDEVGDLPFTSPSALTNQDAIAKLANAGVGVALPTVTDIGGFAASEPGTLVDPYTQQPLTAAQQSGAQPIVPIVGKPGMPGVTYTSSPSVSSFLSTKNSVLGISNGTLLLGAGAIALLAAAAGSR